ncbi:hypothetical protein [Azorhizobium oxalatiphilum]|nr:hypothetical protein [Azorhizobium oxalatiphilum]
MQTEPGAGLTESHSMSLTVPRSPFTWCPDCEGKGVLTSPDGVHTTCGTCGGQGRLRVKQPPKEMPAPASDDTIAGGAAGSTSDAPADDPENKVAAPTVPRPAAAPRSKARQDTPSSAQTDDAYFLGFARHAASRSPQEGGAALVNMGGVLRLACAGGISPAKESGRRKSEAAIPIPAHAADHLIAIAARQGLATAGATLYLTHLPGIATCRLIVSAGIGRVVVAPDAPTPAPFAERDAVRQMFADAEVELVGLRPAGSGRSRRQPG